MSMKQVNLDGISYETPAEVAVAFEKALIRADGAEAALVTEKAEHDATKAKLDSATADLDKVKKVNVDELVANRIKTRTNLENAARKVLGTEEKLDGLKDEEIRSKVILKAYPDAKLDGKSEEYIQARFDSAVDSVKENGGDNAMADARRSTSEHRDSSGEPDSADKARDRMRKDAEERWKDNKGEEKK